MVSREIRFAGGGSLVLISLLLILIIALESVPAADLGAILDFSSIGLSLRETCSFVMAMPIRFLSRLSKFDKSRLGFYVPRYVKQFYDLKPGSYKGGISMEHGEVTSCSIQFSKYRKTLRGKLPAGKGEEGVLCEIWVYRDTWKPTK
ncbi:hypothetical protein EU546_06885 [Candidatus Thorarchaeota archaeon]|nr:MAG: hypothetical protein EU546_06885 [Candidatus Thorarchaeota archaeon]